MCPTTLLAKKNRPHHKDVVDVTIKGLEIPLIYTPKGLRKGVSYRELLGPQRGKCHPGGLIADEINTGPVADMTG